VHPNGNVMNAYSSQPAIVALRGHGGAGSFSSSSSEEEGRAVARRGEAGGGSVAVGRVAERGRFREGEGGCGVGWEHPLPAFRDGLGAGADGVGVSVLYGGGGVVGGRGAASGAGWGGLARGGAGGGVEVGGEREEFLETATVEGNIHREVTQEEGGGARHIPQSWVAPTKRPNRYILKPLLPPRGPLLPPRGGGEGGDEDKGDRNDSEGRVGGGGEETSGIRGEREIGGEGLEGVGEAVGGGTGGRPQIAEPIETVRKRGEMEEEEGARKRE
jgi:hypothetical protein